MAAPTTLVRCSVAVEINGKALHANKNAKLLGVEVSEPVLNGPVIPFRVHGFKREIRFSPKDVCKVVDAHVAEGRLAIVARDGMKLMLSRAQPAQLGLIVRRLQGGKPGDNVGITTTRDRLSTRIAESATPQQSLTQTSTGSQPPRSAATGQNIVTAAGNDSNRAAFIDLYGDQLVRTTIELFNIDPPDVVFRQFAPTCTQLQGLAHERLTRFRLGASRSASIPVEGVVHAISKYKDLSTLDFSGYAELTPTSVGALDATLSKTGVNLRSLFLRGCKALTDVALQRILSHCARLQVLDVMEIPGLSNRALDVALPDLRILAVGSLRRPASLSEYRRPSGSSESLIGLSTLGSSGMVQRLPKRARVAASMGITNDVSLSKSLTHVILANCSEVKVLPRLPSAVQHLDLRGASLHAPENVLSQWRPLSRCVRLSALILAENMNLSSDALLALCGSLHKGTLRVLDISNTRADHRLAFELPLVQPGLTHLRVASSSSLNNSGLAHLLQELKMLEVLDVANCSSLERPFSDVCEVIEQHRMQQQARDSSHLLATQVKSSLPLKRLGIGQTEFALNIEATKRSLAAVAPSAEVIPASLDVFNYKDLPPVYF